MSQRLPPSSQNQHPHLPLPVPTNNTLIDNHPHTENDNNNSTNTNITSTNTNTSSMASALRNSAYPSNHQLYNTNTNTSSNNMASSLRNNVYPSNHQLYESFTQPSRATVPFPDNPLDFSPYQTHHLDPRQPQLSWSHHDPVQQSHPQLSTNYASHQHSVPSMPQHHHLHHHHQSSHPSVYPPQQLPSKRHKPSSSSSRPSDRRSGKDRVERPCGNCGTKNHIRKNNCSHCSAPKDPPKKRSRRRKTAHSLAQAQASSHYDDSLF